MANLGHCGLAGTGDGEVESIYRGLSAAWKLVRECAFARGSDTPANRTEFVRLLQLTLPANPAQRMVAETVRALSRQGGATNFFHSARYPAFVLWTGAHNVLPFLHIETDLTLELTDGRYQLAPRGGSRGGRRQARRRRKAEAREQRRHAGSPGGAGRGSPSAVPRSGPGAAARGSPDVRGSPGLPAARGQACEGAAQANLPEFRSYASALFSRPVPVAGKPAPVADKPAPAADKPAPAADKPAPAENKPALAANKPAPAEDKPAPAENKPAPAANRPAPVENKPAPAADKPVPAADKPAPEATPARGAKSLRVGRFPFIRVMV